jgi:hypothetical protein
VTRVVTTVLIVCVAASVAVVLNLLLLDRAAGRTDRIGKLQPLAGITLKQAPLDTIRPTKMPTTDDGRGFDD